MIKVMNMWRKMKAGMRKMGERARGFARQKWAEVKAWRKRFFSFEVVHDEDLVRAYAGKQYPKFNTRRFNVPAFLFSVIYLLFRKMYIAGVVVFAVEILLFNIVHSHLLKFVDATVLILILNGILGLVIGFLVNRYYIFAVGVKIGRLKVRYPGRSQAEMRGICMAKGGTNSIALTFGFLAKVMSAVVMVINMLFSEIVVDVENPLAEAIENVRSEAEAAANGVKDSLQNGVKSVQETFEKSMQKMEKK